MKKLLSLVLVLCISFSSMTVSASSGKEISIEQLQELMEKMTDQVNSMERLEVGCFEWVVNVGGIEGTVSLETVKDEPIEPLKISNPVPNLVTESGSNKYTFDDGNYTSTITYTILNGTFKLQNKYEIKNNETILDATSATMYASPPSGYTVTNRDAIIFNEGTSWFNSSGTSTISVNFINFTIEIDAGYLLYPIPFSDGTNMGVTWECSFH